jgi:hypothetical protein
MLAPEPFSTLGLPRRLTVSAWSIVNRRVRLSIKGMPTTAVAAAPEPPPPKLTVGADPYPVPRVRTATAMILPVGS